jgi:protein-disulfide isomerase
VVSGGRSPQSQKKRTFFLVLVVLAIVAVAALAYLSTQKPATNVSQVDSTLPAVQSYGYVLGSPQAPLEVLEFGDFECPGCGRFAEITEPDVRAKLINTGKIRLRFIDYPLPMHKNTWNASRAAACADEQGKFWEMHDVLYGNQDQWNGEVTDNPDKVIKGLAEKITGLDTKRFDKCVDTHETQAKVQAHKKLGDDRHVEGTPTFIFGPMQVFSSEGWSYDMFQAYVDSATHKLDSAAKASAGGAKKK